MNATSFPSLVIAGSMESSLPFAPSAPLARLIRVVTPPERRYTSKCSSRSGFEASSMLLATVSNATTLPSPLIAGLAALPIASLAVAGRAADQRQFAVCDIRRVHVLVGFGVGARERVGDRRGERDGRPVAAEIGFVVDAGSLRPVRADADQLGRAGFEVPQVHVRVFVGVLRRQTRGRGESDLAPVPADDRFGRVALARSARRGHVHQRHGAGEAVLHEDVDEAGVGGCERPSAFEANTT